MFRLLGRKRETKEAEGKPQVESGGGEVAEGKENAAQLFDQLNSLVEQREASSSASVRSIIQAAISSAEHIVDSVKTQVVAEARQEAEKIIAEAKKEAEKISSEKKPGQAEAVEETTAVAEPVAEEEEPAPVSEEAVAEEEEPAPVSEEAVAEEEKAEPPEGQVEEPVAEEAEPSPEEPAVVEPAAEVEEPKKAGKKQGEVVKEKPAVVLSKEESQKPYTGEVELNVEVPIEPTMVAKLYNYLQTTPEIKFVRTTGSWNKGSVITILLDKPIPLLAELVDKLPEANILPEQPEGGADAKKKAKVRRISISRRNQ